MTEKLFCTQCGQRHSGPCTVGYVETARLRRRRERFQTMRHNLARARTLRDVNELADVLSDLIDAIEGE